MTSSAEPGKSRLMRFFSLGVTSAITSIVSKVVALLE